MESFSRIFSRQITVNTNIFGFFYSYLEISNSNRFFFVTDMLLNRILIFNENWIYQSFKNIEKPAYMKEIDNNIYISASNSFLKTDKNINILRSHQQTGADYRGLYYDITSQLFYVASETLKRIDVFDKNLFLVKIVFTGSYIPYSINSYQNNELIVGTRFGEILVLNNENRIIRNFQVCRSYITSILVDVSGFMALTCYDPDNMIRLYHVNGTSTRIEKSIIKYPEYVNFDSQGRLVVISEKQIDIYI